MNPNKGRVIISLALVASGMVGVISAMTQSPGRIALLQSPPAKMEPVSTVPTQTAKPIQTEPQQSRSQELANQFEHSTAAQLLKQLTNKADTKVQDSKSAIGSFIQRKTSEQREHFKQMVVDALREMVTEEVTQQSKALSDEFKGIQLSSDQTAQIQRARREMQTEIVQQLQNNPQLLKQLQSDLQAGRSNQALSDSLSNYSDAVAQVLTPQQRQKWQKNFDLHKVLK